MNTKKDKEQEEEEEKKNVIPSERTYLGTSDPFESYSILYVWCNQSRKEPPDHCIQTGCSRRMGLNVSGLMAVVPGLAFKY